MVQTAEEAGRPPAAENDQIKPRQDPPQIADVSACPLSPEHYRALEEAKVRRRRIDRAVGVATFNGWGTAVFAALSLPFAFFSITTLVMCVVLSAVAFHEFKGRRMLRELDPAAPRLLGVNQLVFSALLIVYSIWNIYLALTQPSPYAEALAAQPEITGTLGSIDELYKTGSLAVYGSLIALAIIFQGGMAVYYFKRSRQLREYVDQTPAWIIELQQKTAGSSGERTPKIPLLP